MNKESIIIKDIRIIYFWYHHLNPEVDKKEIVKAINNHDWKTFKKWLKWQEEQNVKGFIYFPDSASVYINDDYYGEVLINEQTFDLIMDNDCECG